MARKDPHQKPRLNLGSGMMLKKNWVNFDCRVFKNHGLKTDVIGRIEDVMKIFGPESFMTILCSHVIEHFLWPDALKVLNDIHSLLKPGGKAILEAPDLLGIYWLYKQRNETQEWLSRMIFGNYEHVENWGVEWSHKSGWTKDLMAEKMEEVGFKIVHKGIGMTHGMGKRDFRVEGIKE